MNTFEERQAYIDQCWREIRESEAKVARSKAMYEEVNIRLQAFWQQYNAEMAVLIYRGMFDPNFCKPGGDHG